MNWLDAKGQLENTDVIFTTDHGELQGDFGLLFKGPYHTDSLMRLPMIWKPAGIANIPPAEVERPVGHVDLAATFCSIAGIEPPEYSEGKMLPINAEMAEKQEREVVFTEWDSEHGHIDMHLKTIYHHDGWLCTQYGKGHLYDGTEGELYNMKEDPDQLINRWEDASLKSKRDELIERLSNELPKLKEPKLKRKAPV